MQSQSTYSLGSIQCKKCGVLCRNLLQYKNHVRNVHQELERVKSSREKFDLPPKWRTKTVGATNLFISPSGELFETVKQVLAEESRRNSLKQKDVPFERSVDGGDMKKGAEEKQIVSSYTTLRSRNWYDGIEFRCDLCKKASFHHDFIYKQRHCPGFDKEKASLACKDTLYQCKICFKEVIHTRKHIKNHLNNHSIDLEVYKIKYIIDDDLVTKGVDNDTKKNLTPEEIADKFSLVKAKLENIKQQKKTLLGTKADSVVEFEQRWCDGYTFNCDMCTKDFYSFKSTSAHMQKCHPFAKEALEKENYDLFNDPTRSGSFFYECKICHNKNIKHDERYIEEHTTSFHKMSLRQYESIYEMNKKEYTMKPEKRINKQELIVDLEDVQTNSTDVINIVNSNQNEKKTKKIKLMDAQVISNVVAKGVEEKKGNNVNIMETNENSTVSNLKIEETRKNEKIKSSKDLVKNDIIKEPKGNMNNKETLSLVEVPPNSIDIVTNAKLRENEKIKMIGSLEEAQMSSNGIVKAEEPKDNIKITESLEETQLNSNILEPKENKENRGTLPLVKAPLIPNDGIVNIIELKKENKKNRGTLPLVEDPINNATNLKLEEPKENDRKLDEAQLSSNGDVSNGKIEEPKENDKIMRTKRIEEVQLNSNGIVNMMEHKENKKLRRKRRVKKIQDHLNSTVQNGTIAETEEKKNIKKNVLTEEAIPTSIDTVNNVINEESNANFNIVNGVKIEEPKGIEKIELEKSFEEGRLSSNFFVNNANMMEPKENELNEIKKKSNLENSSGSTDKVILIMENENEKNDRKMPIEEDQPNSNGIVNFVEPKENERKKRPLEESQPISDHNDNPENTSNVETNPKKAKIRKTNTNETDIYNPPMQSKDEQLQDVPIQNPSAPQETREPLSDTINEETDHSDISEKCSTNQDDAKSPRPLPVRYNWNTPCPSSAEDGGKSLKKMGRLEEAKVSCPLNNCLFITTEEHVQSGRAGLHLIFSHGVEQEDNLSHLLGKFTKL